MSKVCRPVDWNAALVCVDVGDVDVDRRLAADPVGAVGRKHEHAIVVEYRHGLRQGAVVVVRRRALEMIGAEVEEAVVGLAAQIDRRDDVLEIVVAEVDALQLVIVGEELVRQPGPVPAELPVLIEEEVAFGFDRPAHPLIAGAVRIDREGAGLLLVDARHLDAVLAVGQALAPVDLAEEALLRQVGRDQRQIVVRREVDEIGNAYSVPEVCAGNELRREHPGLLVDRRIRRREIRHVEDGKAPDEHLGAFVIDRVGLLVLDDLGRPDLPERRPLGMVLAGFAGGVGSLFEDGHVAVHPLAARRGEAGLVGGQRLDAVDEAVAEILAELEPRPVDDVAVLVGHLGVTFGVDALGGAVVDDAVGLQDAALVEELDRALAPSRCSCPCRRSVVGVDDELVGAAWRAADGGGAACAASATRSCADRRTQRKRDRAQSARDGPRNAGAQFRSSGGADGGTHQPSSWCSKTYTPNKHPTSPGDQPAATALMKPASPRSLITFVAT